MDWFLYNGLRHERVKNKGLITDIHNKRHTSYSCQWGISVLEHPYGKKTKLFPIILFDPPEFDRREGSKWNIRKSVKIVIFLAIACRED